MLKVTSFHKKTKAGGIVKVVRERYLRDDIRCGIRDCQSCANLPGRPILDTNPTDSSVISPNDCTILVLDTSVVLHQIDLLEDGIFNNVVICQTVLEETKHQNASVFKRLQDILELSLQQCRAADAADANVKIQSVENVLPAAKRAKTSDMRYYLFSNEFHKDVYVDRVRGETSNDRNDRAIRNAALWYMKHEREHQGKNSQRSVEVMLITNDAGNKAKALVEGLAAYTVEEYVRKYTNALPEVLDKIVRMTQTEHDKAGLYGGGKRFSFPEHLTMSSISAGLKSGRLKQGNFQVSRDNYLEASVFVGEGEGEPIFVQGLMNCNRAVHGDVVALEMLPESEWSYPSALLKIQTVTDEKQITDSLREIDSDDDAALEGEEDAELKAAVRKKSTKTKDKEGSSKDIKPLPTGKVVGIIKRNWRPYCGILVRSPIADGVRHLFVPAERRIPKVRIESRQADILSSQKIIVSIDSWPRNSRYPNGHFVRALGKIGDKSAENEVLLLEHDIPHHAFSQAVLDCLPEMPWTISDVDLQERSDLRHLDICSVDPPGCTDIDDALHCRELSNGNLEVGVHIADVSHFVRPGNAMDKEAASRGTTVYLVDKRIDMLPELLSSNLCSLRSNVDRFAFSVIWEITNDAEVVSVHYTKSIIQSKASLTYAEAQGIIDDAHRKDNVALSLRRLNNLAKKLKLKRHEAGALSLASLEIRFNIDSETHDPIDVESKKALETNSMVEEFMLLANCQVAQRIFDEFPDCALLRRHPVPAASNYRPVVDLAASKGFTICIDSGKALADSLDKAVIPDNPFFNTMLRILTCRCMTQAVYFSSGTTERAEFVHFGLASPIYTHFTSPIRRYADLIVHRMLSVCAARTVTDAELLDRQKVQKLCNNLNYRHKMAQYAGRASVLLNTHIFFKNRTEELDGYVMATKKNALQVLIPKYGLESAVMLDANSPLKYDAEENCLKAEKFGVVLRVFDRVTVRVFVDSKNIQHERLMLSLIKPDIGLSAPPILSAPDAKDLSPPATKDQDHAFIFG